MSNKTGLGIDSLQKYLYALPPPPQETTNPPCQFLITNKFVVNSLIVLGGTVLQGNLHKYQRLLLGPNSQGEFESVEIQNLEVNKTPVLSAGREQSCAVIIEPSQSLAIKLPGDEECIRKGMVLLEPRLTPKVTREFVVSLEMFCSKG